jgi:hypothetical protein
MMGALRIRIFDTRPNEPRWVVAFYDHLGACRLVFDSSTADLHWLGKSISERVARHHAALENVAQAVQPSALPLASPIRPSPAQS